MNKGLSLKKDIHKKTVMFASYDVIRKIPNVIGGTKNAANKIVWTVLNDNIKSPIKVSQLASKVAEKTQYLHGSLEGSITTLTQDFTGANNLPVIVPDGAHGTRFLPDPSASRYIKTYGSDFLWDIYPKEDFDILEHQYFEGDKIEPRFLLPTIPLILVNGARGIAVGYSTHILPGNINEIISNLKSKLNGEDYKYEFTPYYNGYTGDINKGDNDNQWIINGNIEINKNIVTITEVPVGYSLKSYIKVLEKLEDTNKIVSFSNNSKDDSFYFTVKYDRKAILDKDKVLNELKLSKTIGEVYTCIDENNKVIVFDSRKDIFEYYYNVKIEYLNKRKNNTLNILKNDIINSNSKYVFINEVVNGNIPIYKQKKEDIVKSIEKYEKIIKVNDSYDYLTNLPIYSLTNEKMEQLENYIKLKKESYRKLYNSTVENIWLEDLNKLEKSLS